MGSYTDLSIDGYPILETKSYVIPEVMTLFQESDKRVATRKVSERNELVWGKVSPDEDHDEVAITYNCHVGKVIDRLDVMGFTMRRARKEFEDARISEVGKYTDWAGDGDDDWWGDELDYFTNLTFDRYTEALRTVLTQSIRSQSFGQMDPALDPIVKRIVGDNEDHAFGFLGADFRSFIRLACELVPKNSQLVQDITEVVHAGYYGEGEPVCANSTRALTAGHPENSPRIILTEGSTDVEILREALALLYPHLFGYYTFLDFASSRPQGGAGSLVTTVKAFAAAGISNRIIAVFDNDTAAFDARRSLASIHLPPNIAVCNYPDLNSLEAYPTLGPGGLALLNVNGLAASIELYLGKDVLADDKDFPVQWKGYVESLGKYQGEVMHKARLQERFREKVARCRSSKEELCHCDWSGLRAILEVILHAFD
jgi:hypothetical protein